MISWQLLHPVAEACGQSADPDPLGRRALRRASRLEVLLRTCWVARSSLDTGHWDLDPVHSRFCVRIRLCSGTTTRAPARPPGVQAWPRRRVRVPSLGITQLAMSGSRRAMGFSFVFGVGWEVHCAGSSAASGRVWHAFFARGAYQILRLAYRARPQLSLRTSMILTDRLIALRHVLCRIHHAWPCQMPYTNRRYPVSCAECPPSSLTQTRSSPTSPCSCRGMAAAQTRRD